MYPGFCLAATLALQAIERSFNHGVGVIYLPEGGETMKNCKYAMMLVKALPRIGAK